MLLVERGGGPVFDVGTENRFGVIIFERIFPYAASMCMKAMIDLQPWNRGKELADHRRFTLATSIDVYFLRSAKSVAARFQ